MISATREWHQNIIEMMKMIGTSDGPSHMLHLISQVVAIDSFIIFCYRDQDIPEILFEQLNYPKRENNLTKYLDGAYLLDPFYQTFLGHKANGLIRLKEIAPDHFQQSDYYRKYYKTSGLQDELNYFFPLSNNTLIAVALGRAQGQRNFTGKDYSLLQDIEPVLEYFCVNHWKEIHRKRPHTNERFIRAMNNFGRSILTEKEGEALRFLLKGHSVKSTAERMKISPGTVKLHRNSIYAKLDIGSQTELFSLFIDTLSHMKGDGHTDPLIEYSKTTLKK